MEIEYKNTRFDPDIIPFQELAKKMATAYGYTANLKVHKELAQLLRLYVAQLNQCSYCCILHTKTSREMNITEPKIDCLIAWKNSNLYSDKEKAALAYCEELNKGKSNNFQKYHDNLKKHFSEEEIAEIAAIVINMNVWTRLKLAQGQIPNCKD